MKTPTDRRFHATLFALGLLLYLGVRFARLPEYPIYFFSDEAIHPVIAASLVENRFVYEGERLPTYFRNDRKFSLGATVYLHIIPYLMFGKSVWAVRGTTVLLTLLAAISIGLILKHIFDKPFWWAGPLLLSIVPAWFLHSRTGFETAMACSFYAAFLYGYLRYRRGAPRYLYPALVFGVLTFYSYAPGQLVIVLTGVGLLLSDFRYHWENRRTTLPAAGLLVLFALPYLRFHLAHPAAFRENLQESSSYLVQNYTALEKARLFFAHYAQGLNPLYWYFPNSVDIPRHVMDGYGNILWITLPFALLGLVDAARAVRDPARRAILLALFASPAGAAVSGLGVTRALFFVIPATILTGLGFDLVLEWVQARWVSPRRLAMGAFGILAAGSLLQTVDALHNGPFWHTDYTMYGMQYGARQVFGEIQEVLSAQPGTKIKLSPDWANGVSVLAHFFLDDPLPVELESLQSYAPEYREIDPEALFVIPFSDYLRAVESGKFELQVERSIPDPNGHPAFMFVRARYVANIHEILAQEAAAREVLLTASATLDGMPIVARYSRLDMGEIPNVFDGNDETLVRTEAANPLVVELYLPETRLVSGLDLIIGATQAQITVFVYPEAGAEPLVFAQILEGFLDAPAVSMDFGQTVLALAIRVEILDMRQGEPGHVHLWEIRLR